MTVGSRMITSCATLAMTAAGVMVLPNAHADAASQWQRPPMVKSTYQETSQLNLVGFNPAVAHAHGYKIVTYSNGDQQSVPIDPTSRLSRSPILHRSRSMNPMANQDYAATPGNCGISWIAVAQTGSSRVSVASGFRISFTAYDWDWKVVVANASVGNHTYTAGGAMF